MSLPLNIVLRPSTKKETIQDDGWIFFLKQQFLGLDVTFQRQEALCEALLYHKTPPKQAM